LMILLTACSAPIATRDAGTGIGIPRSATSRNGLDNLKDQDYESSRGRISD
jgi:hypothetical protein